MNFQDQVNNLLRRINNHYPNYSEEEIFIIERVPELRIALLKQIAIDDSFINSSFFDAFNMLLDGVDRSLFSQEEFERIAFSYIKIYLASGKIIPNLASVAASEFALDEEFIKRVQAYVDEYYKDQTHQFPEADIDDTLINEYLDHQRYDLIINLTTEQAGKANIIAETYERIKRECPYTTYPEILINYEKQNGLYIYSLKDSLVDLITEYRQCCNSLDSIERNAPEGPSKDEKITKLQQRMAKTKEIIIEKIKAEQNLDYLNNDDTSINTLCSYYHYGSFSTVPSIIDESNTDEMLKILFDKNCLAYSSILVTRKIITKEDVKNKFNYMVANHMNIPTNIFSYLDIVPLLNEDVTKLLIDNGNIGFIINDNNSIIEGRYDKESHGSIDKYMPYILENIKNNPKYIPFCESVYTSLVNYPEILQAIVETGRLKSIHIDCIGSDDKSINAILEALRINPKLFINSSFGLNDSDDIIISALINNGHLNTVIKCSLLTDKVYDKFKEQIKNIALKNPVLATNLIINSFDAIKKDNDLLYKLLSIPLATTTLIDRINHDEDLTYLYNHDTFIACKYFYAKKYNLDLNHLEIMEQQLGASIIRYFDNPNLQEIVNLPDEEFTKIINLFPKSKYEMVDLEASYESLVQYLFGIKNTETISIFPTFIHAIDDNNLEAINRIKEILIINTKTDLLISIIEKNHLEGINDTEELLNLIINKLSTSEREKYLEILHTLTDDYISNARNYYRSNFYFDAIHPEYSNLYETIINCIDREDLDSLERYIFLIAPTLDAKFYEQFNSNKELPPEYNNSYFLVRKVIEKIADPNKRQKYLPFLKEIVDYYHNKGKEEHAKEITLGAQLDLPYNFEEKNKRNEINKYLLIHSNELYLPDGVLLEDAIFANLMKENIPLSLATDILSYYRGNKNLSHSIDEIKANFGTFMKVAFKTIKGVSLRKSTSEILDENELIKALDLSYALKRIYYIPEPKIDPYQILLNLNINLLKNGLLQNEEMYNLLVEIMKKKKLHLLPANLEDLLDECHISSDFTNIASFINFFIPILESERKRLSGAGKNPHDALTGLASILTQAETYSSLSSVYSQILGDKDAKLIKANPGPNSAYNKLENNGRLKEAVKLTVQNFKRQEITVPPFDETFTLANGKSLDVIVGNFTDPSNLTHGERTGACMRIGGVGETLFDFCLTNPNGFHIRFEDPETHEYISRVSGFRNGNTVFLNELRYSCNTKKYDNLDVVEACKKAAERIIELSKTSPCPIENVVISEYYAMKDAQSEIVDFHIRDNKQGLPKFYSDIGSAGIVLATTAVDKTFVPIDFNKANVPTYQPVRSKVRSFHGNSELVNRINRVASIKAILNGANYEELDCLKFEDGLVYGIVSDDWYIYVDDNLSIHYDYIPLDPRAKQEFTRYMVIIEQMIKRNEIQKEDVYGL